MKIGVVIPCFRVTGQVLRVLAAIGPEVEAIYVVDDCCPDGSGNHVEQHCADPRVRVLRHSSNQGVGGAMVTGYRQALQDGCDIILKLDGDGQMDPRLIPRFVEPIAAGDADYVKGNRFFYLEQLPSMPRVRIFGNAVLSFMTKASSGYWNVMDPTNGYTAVHAEVLRRLPLDKLDRRFFFESDMLFRLNTLRAVVRDIPIDAAYGEERSNLKVLDAALTFPQKHGIRLAKRVFYNYFLRDFNLCSLQLITGSVLGLFGGSFGAYHWYKSLVTGVPATTGTVILAALPVILGFQLVLAAATFDVLNIPHRPLGKPLAP